MSFNEENLGPKPLKPVDIVQNVISRCKEEMDNEKLSIDYKDNLDRASYYTGLHMMNQECLTHPDYKKVDYNLPELSIRKALKMCYLKNREQLTYNDLLEYLEITDKTNFKHKMQCLGYNYVKTENRVILMENPYVTFERYRYIKNIMKYREMGKLIYYIDLRTIKEGYKRPWMKYAEHGISEQLLHVISKNGYENGLVSYNITEEMCLKWITEIVLPSMKPASVLVLDNNPVYSSQKLPSVSGYDTKERMMKCLKENNVPFSVDMHKAELYDLIQRCDVKDKNSVEYVTKQLGHKVLRLPTLLQNLTPTKLLWTYMDDSSITPISSIVCDTLKNIKAGQWLRFEEDIIEIEKQFLEIDRELEEILDEFKIDAAAASSMDHSVTNFKLEILPHLVKKTDKACQTRKSLYRKMPKQLQ